MRSSRRLRNTNMSPLRMSRPNSDCTIACRPLKLLAYRPTWHRGRSSSLPRATTTRRRASRRPLGVTSSRRLPGTPRRGVHPSVQDTRLGNGSLPGNLPAPAPPCRSSSGNAPRAYVCCCLPGESPKRAEAESSDRPATTPWPRPFSVVSPNNRNGSSTPLLMAESRHGKSAGTIPREPCLPCPPLLCIP